MLERFDFDWLPYDAALAMQLERRAQVLAGGPGALFLVTHPPTVTLGRHAAPSNIVDEARLAATGTAVVRVDRGGDVTWHGPGQLVGYPVVSLASLGLGVRGYVRRLSEALERVLLPLGIHAAWDEARPGLWVERRKIAAFGVHVHRGVTTHGFALNVDCALDSFSAIVPCGLVGYGVTSVAAERGSAPPVAVLRDRVAASLADVLQVGIEPAPPSVLVGSDNTRIDSPRPAS